MTIRLGVAIAMLCAVAPLSAQSITQPFASVGFGAPTGTLGDYSDPGLLANLGVTVTRPASALGWRAEVVYAAFGAKRASFAFGGEGFSVESKARVIGGLASATYALGSGDSPTRPYVLGGLGIFSTRIEGTVTETGGGTFSDSESKTSPGLQLGGGVRFLLGGLNAFAEARYQHVLRGAIDAQQEGDNVRWKSGGFIPVTVGLTFGR